MTNRISDERLRELIDGRPLLNPDEWPWFRDVELALRELLAAREQQPVAWIVEHPGYRGLTFLDPQTAEGSMDGFSITPLYAAPPYAPQPAPTAAQGEPLVERMLAARLAWVRELASLGSGCPSDDELDAYHRGFIDGHIAPPAAAQEGGEVER